MDKIRTECPDLPKGWVREVTVRKSGASAGRADVYYYSPDGKKCRSKPQMLQYLPEDYDLENFEFSSGRNINVLLRKRKRRKDDFNFCKDFNISGSHTMPKRQMKKMREKVIVNHMKMKDVEGIKDENKERILRKPLSRNQQMESEVKKRRADDMSHRYAKPKQLFWQRRLQNLKPVSTKTEKPCETSQIDNIIRDLLPGSNNQALLNSIWYSLFVNNKVVGQHAALNALRKHPAALCNIDQPFVAPFQITDEMLQTQEKRVESARVKLTEAQEILKALEEEEMDDLDEINE